jgi:hypothetical protein
MNPDCREICSSLLIFFFFLRSKEEEEEEVVHAVSFCAAAVSIRNFFSMALDARTDLLSTQLTAYVGDKFFSFSPIENERHFLLGITRTECAAAFLYNCQHLKD